MIDIRNENSNDIIFVLQREDSASLVLERDPIGWREDDLEVVRNKQYHGIVTQFTGGLKFEKDAKDFILDAYNIGGLNTDLYLIKYHLRKESSDYKVSGIYENADINIKYEEKYRGLADFETMQTDKYQLSIKFTSDVLEKLIKSIESDKFELERLTDIDGNNITTPFDKHNIRIEGRTLTAIGEHDNLNITESGFQPFDLNYNKLVIPTKFITKGFDRHVEVTFPLFDQNSSLGWQANFLYNDSLTPNLNSKVTLEWSINMSIFFNQDVGYAGRIFPVIQLYRFNASEERYDRIPFSEGGVVSIGESVNPSGQWYYSDEQMNMNGTHIFENLVSADALTIEFEVTNFNNVGGQYGGYFRFVYNIQNYYVKITEESKYEPDSKIHTFSFVNEVAERLMEIITGKKGKFYSKYFGRNVDRLPPSTGATPEYQSYDYVETGEEGNSGMIHGFDIRRFTNQNTLYKSLSTSLKELIKGLQATFNIGVAVENYQDGQRLRFEKLEDFYRPEIVVKLPNQVTNVKRKVESKMFNSNVKMGSEYGGDYEMGLGLDEPNVRTSFSTPLRKTSNKYDKISKYRSDDTGMEIIRRQPEILDRTKDTQQDQHVWYLDTKKDDENGIGQWTQLIWQDVLASQPQGISDPDSYKSWKFTPKRCLLRHGWVIRSGMEQNKYVSYSSFEKLILSSSDANINLSTRYVDETYNVVESAPQLVRSLQRSIVLPEIITFTSQINQDMVDLIFGTTPVEINGEIEQVPNWYFKFQWINENEERETGYLRSFKAHKGQFEMIKANDNLIY